MLRKLFAPEPELDGGGAPKIVGPNLADPIAGPQPQSAEEIEDEAEDAPAAADARPSRQQRRAARGEKFRELRERAEQAEDYRRRYEETQAQLNRMTEALARTPQAAPPAQHQQQPEVQISPEVSVILSAQQHLQREYNKLTPEQQKTQFEEYNRKFLELDVARQERIASEVAARNQPRGVDRDAIRREMLRMRYGDFLEKKHPATGRSGAQMFAAAVAYRVNTLGDSDDSDATLEAAAQEVREKLGLAEPAMARDSEDRERYTATRAAYGRAPASNGSARRIPWDKGLQRIALAAYNDPQYDSLSDSEKMQKWANGPGKRFLKNHKWE